MSLRVTASDRMRRLTAAVVVALYAVLATVGTSLVLCHEVGGHVAIEWRGADCCATQIRTTGLNAMGTGAVSTPDDPGECVECTDEAAVGSLVSRGAPSLRAPSLRDRSVPSPADVPADAVACGFRLLPTPRPAAPAATRPAVPVPPPPLAAIRTVVLRC